jgi:hypothetical protein
VNTLTIHTTACGVAILIVGFIGQINYARPQRSGVRQALLAGVGAV